MADMNQINTAWQNTKQQLTFENEREAELAFHSGAVAVLEAIKNGVQGKSPDDLVGVIQGVVDELGEFELHEKPQ